MLSWLERWQDAPSLSRQAAGRLKGWRWANPQPGDPCHPLAAGAHAPAIAYAFQPRIARNGRGDMGEVVNALTAEAGETGKGDAAPCVAVGGASQAYAVRRITCTEAERLQGFPDGYTAIPWRGKSAELCPDGPRYRALGNSMATNVMAWIGQQIQAAHCRDESFPERLVA